MFNQIDNLIELPSPEQGATLHVLAIGVDRYERAELPQLSLASKDARDIAGAFATQARNSYKNIVTRILTNEQATLRAIKSALESLWSRVKPEDVTVLFLAGHGINHRDTHSYYFAPHDFDESCYSATAIEGAELCRALWQTPGRRILLADTCNAGNIVDSQLERPRPGAGHIPTLLHTIGTTRSRRKGDAQNSQQSFVVLAATGQDTPAVESDRWDNGVFTKALLEALHGGGDNCTGSVTLRMVASHVKNRVRALTHWTQEPVFALAAGADEDYELLKLSLEMTRPGLAPIDPLIGMTIGDFKITSRIEQTARYTLYAAFSESEPGNPPVQLRALSPELSSNRREVERFFNGVKALKQLTHRGFVTVHEMGRLRDGRAHVILGEAGRRRLRDVLQCGKLSRDEVSELIRQLSAALAEAHRAGILYLSLTPSRIIVDEKLKEFRLYDGENLCLAQAPTPPALRAPQERILELTDSAHYQAPECIGGRVSDRTDVYALGALCYQLLSGRPPHVGETLERLRVAQQQPAPPLTALVPELPPPFASLIQRMLASNSSARPSMEEIAATSLRLQREGQSAARPISQEAPIVASPQRKTQVMTEEELELYRYKWRVPQTRPTPKPGGGSNQLDPTICDESLSPTHASSPRVDVAPRPPTLVDLPLPPWPAPPLPPPLPPSQGTAYRTRVVVGVLAAIVCITAATLKLRASDSPPPRIEAVNPGSEDEHE